MLVEYEEGERMYDPMTRLGLIQEYRASEGAKPALSHLGTQAWAKTKARVRKAMNDFFFSSRRRHTRLTCDWSSDVCSSDLAGRRQVRGHLRAARVRLRQ